MKGIKGRFLRRFRSIPSIYSAKHATPQCYESQQKFDQTPQHLPIRLQQEQRTNTSFDEEFESSILCLGRKSNGHITSNEFIPTMESTEVFEDCECGFDELIPEMNTSSSSSSSAVSTPRKDPNETRRGDFTISLSDFEAKCPPGGNDKVILYTTSLRGVRKTYEDCHRIKFLLESFRVVYFERDVSMHLEFRDELWEVLGGRIIPPRLFIKGRHIGGADEVVTLHEIGTLKQLLEGIPVLSSKLQCSRCGGARFLLCPECCGCRKVYKGEQENHGRSSFSRCLRCNENGLIKCETCCL